MNPCFLLACTALFTSPTSGADPQAPTPPTQKVHKIAVGGDGGWDYLTADPEAHRLYVSRGNRVVVVDTEKEAVVGELPETPGVHGIAVVPDLNKGFTSNGSDSSVTVFDLKTLKASGKIKASGTPDAILYDPACKRVFTLNHGTDDTTAIDPSTDKVVGTLALGGEPEAAAADGKGHIFVNIRSKSEIAEFDGSTLKVINRWPLAPGSRPTGVAFDKEKRRLFSVCANQKMVVMDADSGKVISAVDIGRGSDGCVFDPFKHLAYSSNGVDGTVTAVGEGEAGQYKAVATIPTQASARTITIDPKTHRLYLSAATFAPAPAGADGKTAKKGRRATVPGSFVIVVVGD
jgi:YVTN family beta-propeller protein